MTYAAVPALRHSPELDARFSPLLAARVCQPGVAPPDGKAGLLAGMAMTEKQGGSDVRSNTTMARPAPRIALPAAKYWVCKRVATHAAETLECLGGNGYVEDSGMPSLYREAPVNSIWEGSGNVTALDLLRALVSGPGPAEVLRDELTAASGADPRLDGAVARLFAELATLRDSPADAPRRARRLAELGALALQGALLVRHAPPAVADAFCGSGWTVTGAHVRYASSANCAVRDRQPCVRLARRVRIRQRSD